MVPNRKGRHGRRIYFTHRLLPPRRPPFVLLNTYFIVLCCLSILLVKYLAHNYFRLPLLLVGTL